MTVEFSYRTKYKTVANLLHGRRGSVLDVGARDGVLRRFLSRDLEYRSADVAPGCDFVIDLERPLPFPDRSFDYVVALDVLEHVDNLHAGFGELLRIARRGVIVALPNMAYLPHRVSFALRGRLGTDKYDLRPAAAADRHRWLTTSRQAMRFFAGGDAERPLRVATVINEAGGSRPVRLLSWALMRAGLPLSGALSGRTIAFLTSEIN